MKETKDDTNMWRNIPCSRIGRINIVILITINILSKINLLFKATYRLNALPIKFLMAFFTESEQKISQSVWKHKRP